MHKKALLIDNSLLIFWNKYFLSPPQIINEKGGSALKNKGAGEMIEETAENLMKKGVPARTAAYASSMGYLRQLKKK
jgi:hypothetical protein